MVVCCTVCVVCPVSHLDTESASQPTTTCCRLLFITCLLYLFHYSLFESLCELTRLEHLIQQNHKFKTVLFLATVHSCD